MLKWLKRVTAALVVLMVAAAGGIYAASVMRLNRGYDTQLVAFDARSFHISLPEAQRRATSLMCAECHQEAGRVLFEEPGVGKLVAPNLSRIAPTYTDSELERLIRKGVKKDGTAALVMPAKTYAYLADEDVAAIVTWLRSLQQKPDSVPSGIEWGPLGRLGLALDQMPFEADHLDKSTYEKSRPADTGRYIVAATCLHCHRLKHAYDNGFGMKTPSLAAMADSYTFAQFETLLNTGKGIGNREMPFMSQVSRESFAFLTEQEKRAVYDYLASIEQ